MIKILSDLKEVAKCIHSDDEECLICLVLEKDKENQRLTEIIQKLKTDACVCSETEKCIYCIEIEAALEGKE